MAGSMMKAIAVLPGRAGTLHLAELAKPSVQDVADGRGVLVKVLRVGLCGTDKEIDAAEYGQAPPGSDFLVIGHESFGQVAEVGPGVSELAPGDYVVPTVRRPGASVYDLAGMYDMSTDDVYYERGISLLHGYLTEYFVESPEHLIRVPRELKHVAVLLEPTAVIQKGITQAYEIQRRLKIWSPRRAAVLGTGPIGLLASMSLRMRGVEVSAFGRRQAPYRNADLLAELGVRYVSTTEESLEEAAAAYGPFDLIFEATGYSPIAFEAMQHLGKNGVLILSSVTGGGREVQVPADAINLEFVLGNKVMVGTVSDSRDHFEAGIYDLSRMEMESPGWLAKLLTHPIDGLESYGEIVRIWDEEKEVIKAYVKVGEA